MDILGRSATRPFRLVSRQDDLPYPAGEVEFLGEIEEEQDDEAGTAARELYRDLVAQATDRELSEEELLELDAYGMAATVEFGVEQELLDCLRERAPAAAGDAAVGGDRAPAGNARARPGARCRTANFRFA